jgi:hypothetical protein
VTDVEADLHWLNAYANFSAASTNPLRSTITTSADRQMSMFATLRARIGTTFWERSLLYLLAVLQPVTQLCAARRAAPTAVRDVASSSATPPVGWAFVRWL